MTLLYDITPLVKNKKIIEFIFIKYFIKKLNFNKNIIIKLFNKQQ